MPNVEILPDFQQLTIQLISLIFLLFMFKKYAWTPTKEFLAKRQALVSEEFAKAQAKNDEAESLKEQYERQMSDVKSESERIINTSVNDAKVVYEKMLADAAVEVERKQQRADAAIELDRKLAHDKIKESIVDITMTGVEKIIKKEVDATVHERLFEDLVSKVGGAHGQE